MESRQLGQQGLEVAAIGYGAMGITMGYGPTDDTASIAAIRAAHELGVTLFDTCEMYGWGTGEQLLGTALEPIRDEVVIATKFGLTPEGRNSKPDHVRETVENSLRNLKVDVIDVLYQDRPDPEVPIEDVVGTMSEFVDAGKVKYLGLPELDGDSIRKAHAVHPISVLQSEYSIFARDAEQEILPVLQELGIGFVPYSPLARGFLGGVPQPRSAYAADDIRQFQGWWAPENFDANAALAQELTDLAAEKGASISQLALGWLLAMKPYIVPIPGSRSVDRVAENVASAELHLTESDLARIDAIAPNGAFGSRLIFRPA
jgi:aryl-alcohol dehydrogenase-like predicted oxidoreductase